MNRFHIQFGSHRTTITVDTILSSMLAIKLGYEPESKDGNRAVREWLQARLPDKVGHGRAIGKRASQNAQALIIEAIADTQISERYSDWMIDRK